MGIGARHWELVEMVRSDTCFCSSCQWWSYVQLSLSADNGNQFTLERCLKRKVSPTGDSEDCDPVVPRTDGNASNINPTAHRTSRIPRKECKLGRPSL
ncbi:hypothetical protein PVAP13_3NG080009 [Panicum virgatum]|uniref:Uncharacterized protein n=1 Tax=Panicum virgatum TaxID=38727 RepID=A0A8T0U8E0_PANVG|nr:hypothetical protein PVAP13_3NG080009 [Panicum virgatum]